MGTCKSHMAIRIDITIGKAKQCPLLLVHVLAPCHGMQASIGVILDPRLVDGQVSQVLVGACQTAHHIIDNFLLVGGNEVSGSIILSFADGAMGDLELDIGIPGSILCIQTIEAGSMELLSCSKSYRILDNINELDLGQHLTEVGLAIVTTIMDRINRDVGIIETLEPFVAPSRSSRED